MQVSYSRDFIKQSKKLSKNIREKLLSRVTIFIENPLDPRLRNHALRGKYRNTRSIDITGDVRALYIQTEHEAIFVAVGTHSQLYG